MAEDQNWPGLQADEALLLMGARAANQGRDSQLPASARTTNWRDSGGPGFGPPV